jgi:hypothetical protein
MREGNAPETPLEQFTEDVRFLRLFDDGDQPWPRDALGRLLDDVLDPPRPASRRGRRRQDADAAAAPSNIVPIRRGPRDASPPGDA